jgi:hypothetical protein
MRIKIHKELLAQFPFPNVREGLDGMVTVIMYLRNSRAMKLHAHNKLPEVLKRYTY